MSETLAPSRVPSGVPTGGQFSVSARGEATIRLRADAGDTLARAATAFNTVTGLTADLTDATEDRNLVDQVLAEHPDAQTVTVVAYDDGNGPDAWIQVRDANDRIVASRIAPFRPAAVDHYDEDGYALDVDDVLAVDIDAVAEEMDRLLLADILSRRPQWRTPDGTNSDEAVEQARAVHRNLTSRLGFGDGITEPMADNDTIVAAVAEDRMRLSEYDEVALADLNAAAMPAEPPCTCDTVNGDEPDYQCGVHGSYASQARARGCKCDFNPDTTEGPDYECPVHGHTDYRRYRVF